VNELEGSHSHQRNQLQQHSRKKKWVRMNHFKKHAQHLKKTAPHASQSARKKGIRECSSHLEKSSQAARWATTPTWEGSQGTLERVLILHHHAS
jgi:hypothetical protein